MGTWTVLATSTWTATPIDVLFKEPQSLKKRKRKRQGGPRAKRGAAAAELQTAPEDQDDVDDLPPLHVFFNIEAMQHHEQHIANLVVAETDEDDHPVCFPGQHCVQDFLEWLDTLTNNDTHQVNVLAHNFQGYGWVLCDSSILWGQPFGRAAPERV